MSITRKALEAMAACDSDCPACLRRGSDGVPVCSKMDRDDLAALALELGKALKECVSDMPSGCPGGPSCRDCIEHANACEGAYIVESARVLLERLEWEKS